MKRPQRRPKGQKAEDPGDRVGDKGGIIAGKGDPNEIQHPPAERTDPEEKSHRKTEKTRSQDGDQDDGRLSHPEPKMDDRLTPSMVGNHYRTAAAIGTPVGSARESLV